MIPNQNLNNESILSISQNGVDVRGATGSQLLFSTQYPFGKLDKTNPVSFQNISIFFADEPPNPAGTLGNTGPIKTLVYSFPHGYNYVPSTWIMCQNPDITGVGLQPAYFQESFIILATDEGFYTAAELHTTVDAENFNIWVWKYYDQSDTPPFPNIQGFSLNIRVYIFVGDLSGTSAGS